MNKLLDAAYQKERTTKVDVEKTRELEELRASMDKLRKQIGEMKVREGEYRLVANRIFERMREINELLTYINSNKIRKTEEVGREFANIGIKGIDAKKKTIKVEMD
jgi:seryl-tRNA synthetase